MAAMFSQQDQKFMQRALDLAKLGRWTTAPNPAVGCVIVKMMKLSVKAIILKQGKRTQKLRHFSNVQRDRNM